jgi:hypothetical protein
VKNKSSRVLETMARVSEWKEKDRERETDREKELACLQSE